MCPPRPCAERPPCSGSVSIGPGTPVDGLLSLSLPVHVRRVGPVFFTSVPQWGHFGGFPTGFIDLNSLEVTEGL